MKLTKFILFRNTPFIDFQNTVHFSSNEERDNFFLNSGFYPTYELDFDKAYNYIRSKLEVDVQVPYKDLLGYNYGMFESDFEPGKEYYFYLINYEYVNDRNSKLHLLVDPIMTYTQGNVLNELTNLDIEREHLTTDNYEKNLRYLKNNDDVLKTYSKRYIKTVSQTFTDFDVIFQCKSDLTADFGTARDPNMKVSKGITYDKIISPLNLYEVSKDDFTNMMKTLQDYPWIAQNITQILLIPADFIDKGSIEKVDLWSDKDKKVNLYEFKNNQWSKNWTPDKLNMSLEDLLTTFDLNKYERHLLRNEYFTSEIDIWNGQQLSVDLGKLNENTGIKILSKVVLGYNNKLTFYLKDYKADTAGSDNNKIDEGSFINDSVSMDSGDEIPVLIDEYKLKKAESAHQRQLAEDRLLTNRANNVMNGSDLKSRFMDAVSITSNLSPKNLFGKFNDEYEFYRDQQAQFKDLKISSPEVTEQNTTNSLAVANDFFGISLKLSKPTTAEEWRIKKYYKSFGFLMNEKNGKLNDINSMKIANYVKFKGSWFIPNIDVGFMEQMRAQFENGVRLWHNNNTPNPMDRDLINNNPL